MATKATTLATILGETPITPTLKKVEFKKWIDVKKEKFDSESLSPNQFMHVVLICKGYKDQPDVMLAYDTDPMNGCLYLGRWNDGVV